MDSRDGSTGLEAVGSALGAVVGMAIDGPAGAVVGAAVTPAMSELVGRTWGELRGRREANAVEVVVQAAGYAGQDPNDLISIALGDVDRSRLLNATLQAAAASIGNTKVEGLARALANGIDDAARVDEELLVVRALADLDPVHARTLAHLRSQRGEDGSPVRVSAAGIGQFLGGNVALQRGYVFAGVVAPVVAVLERHGLVKVFADSGSALRTSGRVNLAPPPQPEVLITDFGEMCLEYLEQRRKEPAG